MKGSKIVLFLLVLIGVVSKGQDYRPGHIWTMSLRYNPAMMSAFWDVRVVLNMRRQWGPIGGGYMTYGGQATVPIFASRYSKLDAGITFVKDLAGAYMINDGRVALAFTRRFNDNMGFSVGLMGGLVNRQINPDALLWEDQYVAGVPSSINPTSESIEYEVRNYPRIGSGVFLFVEDRKAISGNIGFFVDNFNVPNVPHLRQSYALRRYRYTGHLMVKISLGIEGSYAGAGIYKWHEGGVGEEAYGMAVKYNELDEGDVKLFFSLWYRTNKTMMIAVGGGYRYVDLYYSHDIPFSTFAEAFPSVPTHELSLQFSFNRFGREEKDPLF
ncbi:MAG: type IX secretion system membrane protein PorP/SprF [Chlorobi bacterium]|nr:type IX secretion system membrane protein PorP/SprF [Chlorobiota bacterium]